MVSGQGATATVWTPDLLQTLAQGRQVTIFTNKGLGLSTEAGETPNSTVAGKHQHLPDLLPACLKHQCSSGSLLQSNRTNA